MASALPILDTDATTHWKKRDYDSAPVKGFPKRSPELSKDLGAFCFLVEMILKFSRSFQTWFMQNNNVNDM